ncbi:hypothetical protein ACCO45_012536 [Purpureocillium lilacinum]|uniref:Uncharacterized protein n=1 Tax=Purpureocillium lilacinum TaxID=33203 RepID=A0ACC4D9B8_PURLI
MRPSAAQVHGRRYQRACGDASQAGSGKTGYQTAPASRAAAASTVGLGETPHALRAGSQCTSPISRDGAADPHEAWPTKPARQFENVAVVRKWARHRDPMGGIGPLGQPSRVSANLPKRRNVPTLGDAAAGSSSLTQVAGDPTNKAQRGLPAALVRHCWGRRRVGRDAATPDAARDSACELA